MDLGEYISGLRLEKENLSQYKKWLDVESSHFFSIKISQDDLDFKSQKKIAKKAIDEYSETGNRLVYFSAKWNYGDDNVPLFLVPVSPQINNKERKVQWELIGQTFSFNKDILGEELELKQNDLENWVKNQTLLDDTDIRLGTSALFFNVNTKKHIHNDLRRIKELKGESESLKELFNSDIYVKQNKSPDFLEFNHSIAMDYSQAIAIKAAKMNSIVLSGPPGTGKSQTILNLSIEEVLAGKKVAVLAQKKAALDVLLDRFHVLGLDSLILNYQFKNDVDTIESLESSLYLIKEDRANIELTFNESYFKHCIRTLEDYFRALKDIIKSENHKLLKNTDLSNFKNHSFFQYIYPNEKLISKDVNTIWNTLLQLQSVFQDMDIDFEANTMSLIESLEHPFLLVSKVDAVDLLNVLRSRKKRELGAMKRKIQLYKKKEPVKSCIHFLGKEKLLFLKQQLKENKFLSTLFDSKLRILIKEIEKEYIEWKKLNVWQKIEEVNMAIEYIDWKEGLEILIEDLDKADYESFHSISLETATYIENKLKSDLPNWKFVEKYWLRNKNFEAEKTTWKLVFELFNQILEVNKDFIQVSIESFKSNIDLKLEFHIDNLSWKKLCGLEIANTYDWNILLGKKENKSTNKYPILKNYSKREIIQMAKYANEYYESFCNYRLEKAMLEYSNAKKKHFSEFIKSRKRESKDQRDRWKGAVKYISKNWSKKRRKPSLYSYINKIDNEFLNWLKPITIASLDQFSQYTPLVSDSFDTVIIDESSQIEAIHSIPALFRAKKIIIVGDSNQLSPTRFFRQLGGDKSYVHESLLELAEESLPKYELNYHYRSKYKELIEFSNKNFYGHRLRSVNKNSDTAVEWIYKESGVFDQRRNKEEAKQVVESLKSLSIKMEYCSIGIISFSAQQKNEIEDQIDKECLINNSFNDFILKMRNSDEYMFIKNIEQVQGDERDIILISSGYGKNTKGKFYQFFGPILSFRGENRLNVLMSRARKKIIFISSIKSADIRLKATSSPGLHLFKKLFEFLENPQSNQKLFSKNRDNYWEYFLNPLR